MVNKGEDMCSITPDEIYSTFMNQTDVRKWLFRSSRPSITELVVSLSNRPLFLGTEMVSCNKNEYSLKIDNATIIASFQSNKNTAIGFLMPYLGHHFTEQALSQFQINDYLGNKSYPISRHAAMFIKHLGRQCILSIEFKWLSSGALIVCTNAEYCSRLDTGGPIVHILEYRWFSPGNALRLVEITEKVFGTEVCDKEYDEDSAKLFHFIFNELPGRIMTLDYSSKYSSSCQHQPHSEPKYSSNTLLRTEQSDESVWERFKRNFIPFDKSECNLSISIQNREPSSLKRAVSEDNNVHHSINLSSQVIMDSNFVTLFKVLKIDQPSPAFDQPLLECNFSGFPCKAHIKIHDDAFSNENELHNDQTLNIDGDILGSFSRIKSHKQIFGDIDNLSRYSIGNGDQLEGNRLSNFHVNALAGGHRHHPEHNRNRTDQEDLTDDSTNDQKVNEQINHEIKQLFWHCKICGTAIKGRRSNLNRHIKYMHDSLRPFQCSIPNCKKTFQSKGNLERHKDLVHNREKFQCDKCTRSFNSYEGLERHKQVVHLVSETVYKCAVCGGCFPAQYSLMRHCRALHNQK